MQHFFYFTTESRDSLQYKKLADTPSNPSNHQHRLLSWFSVTQTRQCYFIPKFQLFSVQFQSSPVTHTY